MAEEPKYSWTASYKAIASKLGGKRQQEAYLLNICNRHANMQGVTRMDPLTFMALFNRRQKDETRTSIVSDILSEFGIKEQAPQDYYGIPVVNNQQWRYMDGDDAHIDEKWDFFESALRFTDGMKQDSDFASHFDTVLAQKNIGLAKLTMALYWCFPDKFLPLDANTTSYLYDAYFVKVPKDCDGLGYLKLLEEVRSKTVLPFQDISAAAYEYDWGPLPSVFDPGIDVDRWAELVNDEGIFTPVSMDLLAKMIELGGAATCKELSEAYGDSFNHYNAVGTLLGERITLKLDIEPRINQQGGNQYWSVPFLGKKAKKDQSGSFVWRIRPELKDALLSNNELLEKAKANIQKLSQGSHDDPPASSDVNHWLISPGENAWAWDEFKKEGIASIGWDYLGDHSKYDSKEQIAAAINKAEGDKGSRKNDAAACYLFSSCMKPGDVIYAKSGMSKLLGRGTVTSYARFDDSRNRYKNLVSVDWTDIDEWEIDGFKFPMKTLTGWYDKYPELDALIDGEQASGWWLTASPKIWSFADINIGEEQNYTLFNERGNPRRIHKNFLEAKPGDIVIGYEATPVKAVVSVCEIAREHDNERMYFRKVRDLSEPIPFEAIKDRAELADMEFLKNPNGSFFKLTGAELSCLMELAYEEHAAPAAAVVNPYSDEDFLRDVYMEASDYEDLKGLAREKKNIILQGAPGTGKTFAAERLAWALMGCKDGSRVEKVQFHQSTSYDEFVIGFRPNQEGGFLIEEGPFVKFCNRAAADKEKAEYYFIIDEINRANISKVFGELLMLIEDSHRGEGLKLGIDGRRFSVPKNVTIIGMMNTADRGLALIDYALRRRFAFFDMKPALNNENFKKRVDECEDDRMPALVEAVRKLNGKIESDPALGDGFRVGHSYFCKKKEHEARCVDSIVKYELIPLVKEYWFDDHKTAAAEIGKLKGLL